MHTLKEDERKDDGKHLLAIAKAFAAAGRNIPSGILRRLWGLRDEWARRRDIPEQLRAACELLDRHAPTKTNKHKETDR